MFHFIFNIVELYVDLNVIHFQQVLVDIYLLLLYILQNCYMYLKKKTADNGEDHYNEMRLYNAITEQYATGR